MHKTYKPALTAALVLSVVAANAQYVSLGDFNHVHTGPRAVDAATRPTSVKRSTQVIDSALIAPGDFAELRMRIHVNAHAANWTSIGNLISLGFAPVGTSNNGLIGGAGGTFGGPMIHFQNNQAGGTGYTWDNKFLDNSGGFVYTSGSTSGWGGLPNDNSDQNGTLGGSFADYSIKLFSDNTYLLSVTLLDADGEVLTNLSNLASFHGATNANPQTMTGTSAFALGTDYEAVLRIRPGADTGGNSIIDPETPWAFTVTNAELRYQPVPEPATMAALGIGALALLRRRKKA